MLSHPRGCGPRVYLRGELKLKYGLSPLDSGSLERRLTFTCTAISKSTQSIMASPKITLYFDIVSPFAYIAFYVLKVSCSSSLAEVLDIEQS